MRGREIYQLTRLANRYIKSDVMQQVQEAWTRRGDEKVRIERQRRRLARKRVWASRWLTAWVLITMLCGLLIVGVATGAVADGEGSALVGVIAATLVAVVITFRSTLKLAMAKNNQREFEAIHPRPGVPAAATGAPAAMPPKRSAAREPMQRLAEAEEALGQVLAQLSGTDGVPAAVPVESVAQARATSTEAATALRAVAAQLVAVELARDHAPPLERGPLVEGVSRLREQLDEGLDGYRSLVAAAGRVVAASSAPGPKQELTEATDHLAGLAVALRELSDAAD
ncbi:phage shock envelope stress response protein PspM [Actinophytocola sp.]|uniref:phage shock envelope stress response protein PspM n=1 Tax=Actinophytocola sp. TaxID=1872138 RepID=UPI003D6A5DEF